MAGCLAGSAYIAIAGRPMCREQFVKAFRGSVINRAACPLRDIDLQAKRVHPAPPPQTGSPFSVQIRAAFGHGRSQEPRSCQAGPQSYLYGGRAHVGAALAGLERV